MSYKLKNFIKRLIDLIYIIMIIMIVVFFLKILYDVYDLARNLNFFDVLW